MKNEEQLGQAFYALEQYKGQIENLSRQRQMVMLSLEEHMRAKITLSEWSKQKEGHEMLMPIGANTFLYAKAASPDKALIGIGGDVVMEDSSSGAMDKLEDVIKILEDADKKIIARISEIEKQSAELSAEVEGEMKAAEGRNKRGD